MKKALITGIAGQDGSYLSELLLEKGYEVAGIIRAAAEASHLWRIEHIMDRLSLVEADIADLSAVRSVIRKFKPDEIYNLASQSHVSLSFKEPFRTVQTVAMGALDLFEAVRLEHPTAKVYQASSSEMFGNSVDPDGFQRETTAMEPNSPYACSKLFAYQMGRSYRAAYGLFISNGILFNHESSRRPATFVTSKICREAVRIKQGLTDKLELGNVEACRDWGHAKDYVKAMWLILQHDTADDYVCSTGVTHSVRDVVEYVFTRLGLDIDKALNINPELMRPADRETSRGDSSKLRRLLNWQPEYTFESMLDEMIAYWTEVVNSEQEAQMAGGRPGQ